MIASDKWSGRDAGLEISLQFPGPHMSRLQCHGVQALAANPILAAGPGPPPYAAGPCCHDEVKTDTESGLYATAGPGLLLSRA